MSDFPVSRPQDAQELANIDLSLPIAPRADVYEGARTLVARLRGPSKPRTRSGIVRLAPKYFGREADVAAHLGADCESVAQHVLESLPVGAVSVPLNALGLLSHLDVIASSGRGSECVLVTHLDLLLAKLDENGRERFWDGAFKGMPHRPRIILLAMPHLNGVASRLEPFGDDAAMWQDAERLVEIAA